MAEPSPPCVLIVADVPRLNELVTMLNEPLPAGATLVLVSTGGDDTLDTFEERAPHVVIVTATLETGDSSALIEAMRGMSPRAEVGFVLIGDPDGPMRTVLDAGDIAPDRFLAAPVVASTLRFAVNSVLEAVLLIRGTQASRGIAVPAVPIDDERDKATRLARWEALADAMIQADVEDEDEARSEAAPLPPPFAARGPAESDRWQPGTTAEIDSTGRSPWSHMEAPMREPTLILPDPAPSESNAVPTELGATSSSGATMPVPMLTPVPLLPSTTAPGGWASAIPLAQMIAKDHGTELDDDLDDVDVQLDVDELDEPTKTSDHPRGEPAVEPPPIALAVVDPPDGRDFARQLRAKMSMMAQRLFQGGVGAGVSPPAQVDISPRHDHHTEIDLSSLGDDLPLERGVTEIESRANRSPDAREVIIPTSPGTWDTAIRERGLPDHGELIRGVSDAAMLAAKMFAHASTGRIVFRRDAAEKVIFFDQGRPVFAASNERRDRMGELLVREGKITAAQYERCQTVVAESGRRMGEILVDLGYLKRRELLPAVRRHVEDIVYSLFGWDRGSYRVLLDDAPSSERIRLSRHPAALILEGVRRKLDRSTLERLVGSPSTVIEVPDRERLGGIINLGDLAPEERGALAAFDAQSDLASVASATGVDVADVLPLAWGLCVLGLATARRIDTELPDELSALVGETDIVIDRERVRARWQLVTDADYFALLGVRRDATGFEIRRAYQAARRDFAADGFPNDLRRELAQELDDIAHVLDEAFRVLRDDRLRVTYLTNLID